MAVFVYGGKWWANEYGGKTLQKPIDFFYDPASLTSNSVIVYAEGGGNGDNDDDFTNKPFAFTWSTDSDKTKLDNAVWFIMLENADQGRYLEICNETIDLYIIAAKKQETVDRLREMKLKPNTTYYAWTQRLGDSHYADTTAVAIKNKLNLNDTSGCFQTKPTSIVGGKLQCEGWEWSEIWPYILASWVEPVTDPKVQLDAYSMSRVESGTEYYELYDKRWPGIWPYINMNMVDVDSKFYMLQATGGKGTGSYYFYYSEKDPIPPTKESDKWIRANGHGNLDNCLILPKETLPYNAKIYVWCYRAGDSEYKDSPIVPLYSSSKYGTPIYWFTTLPEQG